jgi:uncharacterized membrane protein
VKMEVRFLLSGIVLAITALVQCILALLYLVHLTEGVVRIPRHETVWVSTALFAAVLAATFYHKKHFERVWSAIEDRLVEEEARGQLARRAMAIYVATAVALLITLLLTMLADHAYQLQLLEYPVFHYALVAYVGFAIAFYIAYDGLRERNGEAP